jgi:DNA-binding NarL/FixJ family response regulator
MKKPIQTAILAPTLAARIGLRTLLAGSESIQIRVETANPDELAYVWSELDIVVIQDQEILADLETLLNADSKPGLLWISDHPDAAQILHNLPLSAWGLLSSEASRPEMTAAIAAIYQGLIVAPRERLAPLWIENQAGEPSDLIEQLTPRETEILELLAQGLANKQIALDLEISEHTVKFHVSSIYTKLGVANRMEAVRLGLQQGLITI